MQSSPQSGRLHIAIFGCRNSGKSSLINALTGQATALVDAEPGTTTEPVYQPFAMDRVGEVVLVDTSGIDDDGDLGRFRVHKTRQVLDETDLGIVIFSQEEACFQLEKEWYRELAARNIPVIGVINKVDERYVDIDPLEMELNIPIVKLSAKKKFNLGSLKDAIRVFAPAEFERASIVGDLVQAGDTVLLVTPEILPAPKYRLVASQQQILRDLLDHHAMVVSVTDSELPAMLAKLNGRPNLVIIDSQVYDKVDAVLPKEVPLTTFAILMARFKGDLDRFLDGAKAIESLKPGDKVLLSEACIQHPHNGEIDREFVKRRLHETAGGELAITAAVGPEFPENVGEYRLVVHCGGCIFNRKQLMMRLLRSGEQGVPITNYGIAYAYFNGMLPRVTDVLYAGERP